MKKKKTDEKNNLSIVILSYNVRELLVNCIDSLLKDPDSINWQIIIVDNNSQDDSVNFIKKNYPNILLIESKNNLGFSAGNNLAIDRIESKYVLFLNPDTLVRANAISTTLRYLSAHPQVGAATCKVELPNGIIDEGCHRGFPTPWNALCHFSGLSKIFNKSKWFSGYILGYKNYNEIHEIDALTGAFMMIPTSVGKQLDWWDEDYFWNGEDIDFCYRIKQLGLKVMYLPDVKITHFKGSSGGYKKNSHGKETVNKETKILAAKSSTQAMKIFYEKHYKQRYPRWLTWISLRGIDLLEKVRVLPLQLSK